MSASVPSNGAFTLVEVLVVVVVVSILGAVGYSAANGVREASRETKLRSDNVALNNAVQIYQSQYTTRLTNDFSGTNVAELVRMLQSRASTNSATAIVGVRGALFDEKAVPVMQTTNEAASSQTRIVWNAATTNFVVTNSGGLGIKEFRFPQSGETVANRSEDRSSTLQGATEGQWVWNYATPAPSSAPALNMPGVGNGTVTPAGNASLVQQLSAPVFNPPGGTVALAQFDRSVTVTNPNPAGSSQLYVQIGSGVYQLYQAPLSVPPGTTLNATAFTVDPARFSNGPTASASYTATPVLLQIAIDPPATSLTYQNVGGTMPGQPISTPPNATLRISNLSEIPTAYRTASNYQILYTVDGSNPLTSNTAVVATTVPMGIANWSANATLTVRAVARAVRSDIFQTSAIASTTFTGVPTTLAPPAISPPSTTSSSVLVSITQATSNPANSRIQYTTDGTDPGAGANPASGTAYTGNFTISGTTVTARAYGPSALAAWFSASPSVAATYFAPSVPEGALVGNADVNGVFVGSLIYARPSGNVNFNAGAQIVGGNVYFPGTPEVIVQPTQYVARGQDFVAGASIPRQSIQGRQFNPDGTEVVPATDTRQIVDLTGSRTPSNYTVRINNNVVIQGKLFRRADPPPFPVVTVPTDLVSRSSIIQNSGAAPVTLPSGRYGSVTVNSGTIIRLGVAGSMTPTRYVFDSFNLNGAGRVEVLGPVELTIPNGFNVNSSILGDPAHPEWLTLLIANGGMNMNSSSTTYAAVVAPTSTVILNGTFNGSVVANQLTINGNGIAFTLPPVIQ